MIWLLTTPYLDAYDEKKKLVLKTFQETSEAFEEFYTQYMKEILSRNRYMQMDSLLQLECYGPNIVDAVTHNPLEMYLAQNITQDMIAAYQFTKDEGRQLQQQMLRFYREGKEYEAMILAAKMMIKT